LGSIFYFFKPTTTLVEEKKLSAGIWTLKAREKGSSRKKLHTEDISSSSSRADNTMAIIQSSADEMLEYNYPRVPRSMPMMG
jgi:hypothetical protein